MFGITFRPLISSMFAKPWLLGVFFRFGTAKSRTGPCPANMEVEVPLWCWFRLKIHEQEMKCDNIDSGLVYAVLSCWCIGAFRALRLPPSWKLIYLLNSWFTHNRITKSNAQQFQNVDALLSIFITKFNTIQILWSIFSINSKSWIVSTQQKRELCKSH